ncbi:hypothetical protein JCM11641_005155 [Rhodosporidiobolus odoratus]
MTQLPNDGFDDLLDPHPLDFLQRLHHLTSQVNRQSRHSISISKQTGHTNNGRQRRDAGSVGERGSKAVQKGGEQAHEIAREGGQGAARSDRTPAPSSKKKRTARIAGPSTSARPTSLTESRLLADIPVPAVALSPEMMELDEAADGAGPSSVSIQPLSASSRDPARPSEPESIATTRGPAKSRSTATTKTRRPLSLIEPELPSPAPVDKAVPSLAPPLPPATVLELSSADELETTASPRSAVPSHLRRSLVRAPTSAALLALQARRLSTSSSSPLLGTTSSSKATANTTRKKPRPSLEAEIANLQKLSGPKLAQEFRTISDFVEYLSAFETAASSVAQKALVGTRICFVNTDHWTKGGGAGPSTTTPTSTQNRFDQGLRTIITIASKAGATLVKPDEFTPPPFDVNPNAPVDEEQAIKEGWTTHIIPFVPDPKRQRQPTLDEVKACLGGEAGIEREELGDFVQVVRFEWVSRSVEARSRVAEWPFEIGGDWRKAAQEDEADGGGKEEMRGARGREAREKRRREEERRKRPGYRGRGAAEQEDTDEGEVSEGEMPDRISPFASDDYPAGEAPPPGYFDRPSTSLSQTSISSLPHRQKRRRSRSPSATELDNNASDLIVDADQTRLLQGQHVQTGDQSDSPPPQSAATKMDGLERELQLLKEYGAENVDEWLQAEDADAERTGGGVNWEDEFIIMSTRTDDNETEEEEEAEEEERLSRAKAKGQGKAGFDARRSRRWEEKIAKYACDDPNTGRRDGPNENVAKVLDLLSGLQDKTTDKGQFRERGYRLAAGRLRNYPFEVTRHEDLVKLRGIGPKLATKIMEIRRTGTHRRVSVFDAPKDRAARTFGQIWGVGPNLAQDFYDLGARSVEDLRKDPDRFGLHENQRMGLRYYEELLERIPREEMDRLFEVAQGVAAKIDPKLQVYCMGSYRRGAETSGDIDLLVTRSTEDGRTHAGAVRKLWQELGKLGFAQHTLSEPNDWDALDAKVNGLCRLPKKGSKMRRIDILGVPHDELAPALIYFTGNDYFNRSLRLKARHLGLRLNQRGLYKNVARGDKGVKLTEGVRIKGLDTEEKVFKVLKVTWRPPEERIP